MFCLLILLSIFIRPNIGDDNFSHLKNSNKIPNFKEFNKNANLTNTAKFLSSYQLRVNQSPRIPRGIPKDSPLNIPMDTMFPFMRPSDLMDSLPEIIENCNYNWDASIKGNKCPKNVWAGMSYGVDLLNALCSQDDWGVISVAGTVASKIAGAIPEADGAGDLIADVIFKPADGNVDCLAQINEKLDAGFKRIEEKIDEAVKKLTNVIGAELKENTYYETVRSTLYSFDNYIKARAADPGSASILADIKEHCTEKDNGLKSAIHAFEFQLYGGCLNRKRRMAKKKLAQTSANNQTSFDGVGGCLTRKVYERIKDNPDLISAFTKKVYADGLHLSEQLIYCMNVNDNIKQALNDFLKPFQRRITETLDYVRRIMHEDKIEKGTITEKVINGSLLPQLENVDITWDAKHKQILEAACKKSISEVPDIISCNIYKNISEYEVNCPKSVCMFLENYKGYHIFVTFCPTYYNLPAYPSEKLDYFNSMIEKSRPFRDRIVRQYGDNIKLIAENFRKLFPYATGEGFKSWFISSTTKGEFITTTDYKHSGKVAELVLSNRPFGEQVITERLSF